MPTEVGLDPANDLPEPLRGKSPVEVYRALYNEFEAIKKMEDAEKAQLRAEKTTLENIVKNAPKMPAYQPPVQEEPLWTGPDDIVNKVRAEMGVPLKQMAESLRATNRNNFVMGLKQSGKQDEWEKYGGEIEQAVNAFALDAQSRPEAYEAAYSYIRGTHVDEILKEKLATTTEDTVKVVLEKLGFTDKISEVIQDNTPPPSLFQRQTGVPHVGKGRSVNLEKLVPKHQALSAEQLRIAVKFGMTPEEYVKNMEER
jgi:hypothetical protein